MNVKNTIEYVTEYVGLTWKNSLWRCVPDRRFETEPKESIHGQRVFLVQLLQLRHRLDERQAHLRALGHQIGEQLFGRTLWIENGLKRIIECVLSQGELPRTRQGNQFRTCFIL